MGKIHELGAQPDNNLQDTFYCDPVDLSGQGLGLGLDNPYQHSREIQSCGLWRRDN